MKIGRSNRRFSGKRAFSLVELLLVMAIMGLLVGSGLMGFSSFQNQSFTKQAYDLREILASAKTSAMAKNTFVWVGFGSATVAGRTTTAVATFASRNGLNDASAANLNPLFRLCSFPNFTLANAGQLAGSQTQLGTDISATSSYWQLPNQTVDGVSVPLTQAILFSPNGQCFLASDTLSYIDIGVRSTRGTATNELNVAALQVSGLTSQVQLFRE